MLPRTPRRRRGLHPRTRKRPRSLTDTLIIPIEPESERPGSGLRLRPEPGPDRCGCGAATRMEARREAASLPPIATRNSDGRPQRRRRRMRLSMPMIRWPAIDAKWPLRQRSAPSAVGAAAAERKNARTTMLTRICDGIWGSFWIPSGPGPQGPLSPHPQPG